MSNKRAPFHAGKLPPPPAEPNAGDVEALTDEALDALEARLAASSHDRLRAIVENPALTDEDYVRTRRDDMRAALTPLLDAVGRKAGDERAEEIAQAIEADRDGYLHSRNLDTGWIAGWRAATRHHAARIARESR